MAICLPGMASSTKRAATSLMRPAPLVTTTSWMTSRIRNTTTPTTKLPPTTNCPKVSMTLPPVPVSRIRRVEATLRPRRSRVVISSRLGKALNSSGSLA